MTDFATQQGWWPSITQQQTGALLQWYRDVAANVGRMVLPQTVMTAADDRVFFLIAMVLAHSGPFFGLNVFYTLLSAITSTQWKKRWRFQGAKPVPRGLLFKAIAYTTAFHAVMAVAFAFLIDPLLAVHPQLLDAAILPTLPQLLVQLAICYASTDFFFYWGHRLLHWGPLYRRIHKQHHEFYVSVGWAAEYSHPLELVLGNMWPVLSGPLLMKCHAVVWITWMVMAITGTTVEHSGFWYPSAVAGYHDFHHSRFSAVGLRVRNEESLACAQPQETCT